MQFFDCEITLKHYFYSPGLVKFFYFRFLFVKLSHFAILDATKTFRVKSICSLGLSVEVHLHSCISVGGPESLSFGRS